MRPRLGRCKHVVNSWSECATTAEKNRDQGGNVEPATAVAVVSKLIGLGIKGWQALDDREFDKDDLEACARCWIRAHSRRRASRKP